MTMKGDKSLEMIIGIIVLLVVAVVVINLFLGQLNTGKLEEVNPQCKTARDTFVTDCSKLCSDFKTTGNMAKAKAFCENSIELDLDCDKKISMTESQVSPYLDICEDNVYCFMVQECQWGNGNLDWQECAEVLCDVYMEKYADDVDSATEAVFDKIQTGSCRLPQDETLNWFQRFYGQNPCGF